MLTLADLPPFVITPFVIALGLMLGSFLNVVIYRLPLGQSVVSPPSSCPACGTRIRAVNNIPLLGWLLLRGKARCCGAKISARYPLVEALGGLFAWAVLVGLVEPSEVPLATAFGLLFVYLFFCLCLLAAIFIDFDHMLLPDELTIALGVVGLISLPLRDIAWLSAAIGGVSGFLLVWVPFILLYRVVRGHPGMGLGDAKLLAAVGLWFGVSGVLFTLMAGAVQGTLFALAVYAVQGQLAEPEAVTLERAELKAQLEQLSGEARALLAAEIAEDPVLKEPESGLGKARLAFGPFLALAAIEYLFFGDYLVAEYLGWIW